MDFSSSDEEEMARIEEEMRTPKTNQSSASIMFTPPTKGRLLFGDPQNNQALTSNFSRFSSRTVVPSSTSSSPPAIESAPQSPTRAGPMPGSYSPSPIPNHSPTSPQEHFSPIESDYIDPDATLLANSIPTRNTTSRSITNDPIIAFQWPTSAWTNATQGLNILIERASEAADLRTQLTALATASAEKDAAIASLRDAQTKSKARQKRKIKQLREEIAEWDVDQLGIEEMQFRHGFEKDEMQAEIWRLENALADASTFDRSATVVDESGWMALRGAGAIVLRWVGKVAVTVLTVLLGIVSALLVVGLVVFALRGGAHSVKGEL